MSLHARGYAAARLAIALAGLALAACGSSATTATNPSPSPAETSPAAAKAPCTGNKQATVNGDGGLVCASGIAKINVLIGHVNPPANGPKGTPHLALLEDHGGSWVIANYTLCTVGGQPTQPSPAELGTVCGLP
jgi:hypothetical protein